MVVRRGESPDKNETKDVEEEEEQQEEIFDDPENEDDDMIQLRKQYVELEIVATKTNGKLRLDICEDFYDEKRGLFIQSFLRPCLVEEEGLIKIGDELISINHHTVDGYTIDQLVDVLKVADSPTSTTALLGIRRRVLQKMYTCGNYSNEEPEGEDLNEDNQFNSSSILSLPNDDLPPTTLQDDSLHTADYEIPGFSISDDEGEGAEGRYLHDKSAQLSVEASHDSPVDYSNSLHTDSYLSAPQFTQSLTDDENTQIIISIIETTIQKTEIGSLGLILNEQLTSHFYSSTSSSSLPPDNNSPTPNLIVMGFSPDHNCTGEEKLCVGDELLSINGFVLEKKSLEEVLGIVNSQDYQDKVEIPVTVRRKKRIPQILLNPEEVLNESEARPTIEETYWHASSKQIHEEADEENCSVSDRSQLIHDLESFAKDFTKESILNVCSSLEMLVESQSIQRPDQITHQDDANDTTSLPHNGDSLQTIASMVAVHRMTSVVIIGNVLRSSLSLQRFNTCDINMTPRESADDDVATPRESAHDGVVTPRESAHDGVVTPRESAHDGVATPRESAHDGVATPRESAHDDVATPRESAQDSLKLELMHSIETQTKEFVENLIIRSLSKLHELVLSRCGDKRDLPQDIPPAQECLLPILLPTRDNTLQSEVALLSARLEEPPSSPKVTDSLPQLRGLDFSLFLGQEVERLCTEAIHQVLSRKKPSLPSDENPQLEIPRDSVDRRKILTDYLTKEVTSMNEEAIQRILSRESSVVSQPAPPSTRNFSVKRPPSSFVSDVVEVLLAASVDSVVIKRSSPPSSLPSNLPEKDFYLSYESDSDGDELIDFSESETYRTTTASIPQAPQYRPLMFRQPSLEELALKADRDDSSTKHVTTSYSSRGTILCTATPSRGTIIYTLSSMDWNISKTYNDDMIAEGDEEENDLEESEKNKLEDKSDMQDMEENFDLNVNVVVKEPSSERQLSGDDSSIEDEMLFPAMENLLSTTFSLEKLALRAESLWGTHDSPRTPAPKNPPSDHPTAQENVNPNHQRSYPMASSISEFSLEKLAMQAESLWKKIDQEVATAPSVSLPSKPHIVSKPIKERGNVPASNMNSDFSLEKLALKAEPLWNPHPLPVSMVKGGVQESPQQNREVVIFSHQSHPLDSLSSYSHICEDVLGGESSTLSGLIEDMRKQNQIEEKRTAPPLNWQVLNAPIPQHEEVKLFNEFFPEDDDVVPSLPLHHPVYNRPIPFALSPLSPSVASPPPPSALSWNRNRPITPLTSPILPLRQNVPSSQVMSPVSKSILDPNKTPDAAAPHIIPRPVLPRAISFASAQSSTQELISHLPSDSPRTPPSQSSNLPSLTRLSPIQYVAAQYVYTVLLPSAIFNVLFTTTTPRKIPHHDKAPNTDENIENMKITRTEESNKGSEKKDDLISLTLEIPTPTFPRLVRSDPPSPRIRSPKKKRRDIHKEVMQEMIAWFSTKFGKKNSDNQLDLPDNTGDSSPENKKSKAMKRWITEEKKRRPFTPYIHPYRPSPSPPKSISPTRPKSATAATASSKVSYHLTHEPNQSKSPVILQDQPVHLQRKVFPAELQRPQRKSTSPKKPSEKQTRLNASASAPIMVGNPTKALKSHKHQAQAQAGALVTRPKSSKDRSSSNEPASQLTFNDHPLRTTSRPFHMSVTKYLDRNYHIFETLVEKTHNSLCIALRSSSSSNHTQKLLSRSSPLNSPDNSPTHHKGVAHMGSYLIESIHPESNAFRQGILRVHDEILEINCMSCAGIGFTDLTELIQRDRDQYVLLLICRRRRRDRWDVDDFQER